jgi:hypothetical protein
VLCLKPLVPTPDQYWFNQSAIVMLKTYLIMGTQLVGFIRGSRNEFNYVTMLYFLSDYTPVMVKSSSFTVSAGFCSGQESI